jgi:hypothetical protein
MPNYSDKDNEAFIQISQFGPAGRESSDPSMRGLDAMQKPSLSYAREDLEQFNRLMDFGDKRSMPTARPQAKAAHVSSYTASDIAQFERLMPPTSESLFKSTPESRKDTCADLGAGQYTTKDRQAFEALMRLEPGMEIAEPKPAPPRAPATTSRATVITSVPVRASIKIVDADAERARERESIVGGVRRIKIVFSEAGGPERRDREA